MNLADQTLRQKFGFEGYLEGQEPVIRRLIEGASVVAIFPTGAGKSLCYQLPALLLPGVTVVISPLIALMKDQIDFLRRRGIAAARLDSSLTASEVREVHQELRDQTLKLLYIAPERLANERFLATLGRIRISLLAIDEAHCISEWGHNFRPDYLKLAGLAGQLRVERVLALTATATPEVARDVARAFAIPGEDIVQTGFHRPNLFLRMTPCRSEERYGLIEGRLRSGARGPAIVYVTLQRTAGEIAGRLARSGLPARAYHAGLESEERHAVQDWFMASDEAIVVATIAFGMGIDKANIRAIYHYNMPKSLEGYAQEIGRAGRDGKPALCELLACPEDVVTLENFTFGDTPTQEAVRSLLEEVLGSSEADLTLAIQDLSVRHDVRPLVIETLLTYLELAGNLRSIGTFYSDYRFRFDRPLEEVRSRLDPDQSASFEGMLRSSRKARIWWNVNHEDEAAGTGAGRPGIVAMLGCLEERGDLTVEATGLRKGYRRLQPAGDLQALASQLTARFTEREARDIQRVQRMLGLATDPGCTTGHLLAHFGETIRDCGHCGSCAGERTPSLPEAIAPLPGVTERELVVSLRGEGHRALASPRQLARFLCGLASPATTRSRLTRDPRFGALEDLRFADVLELARSRGDRP